MSRIRNSSWFRADSAQTKRNKKGAPEIEDHARQNDISRQKLEIPSTSYPHSPQHTKIIE